MVYSHTKQSYFYLSLFHMYATVICAMTVTVTVDTTYVITVLHTCGLFNFVGAYLACTFDCCDRNGREDCKHCTSFKKIVEAARYHKRAMWYAWQINVCYAVSYAFQLVIIVSIFSVLLFCLYHAATVSKDVEKTLMYGFHSIGLPFVVFLNVIPAQKLIDCSASVFHKAYEARWYMGTVPSQRLLLIIMQRSKQPCTISVANTLTSSYEMFATIMQASLSYFMVLYSMR
ncbi:hypothetical protein KM043_014015 [Ampulex compressa]|nr:hypothetical protein KM043_014015 [Ampulex compressa]